MHDCVLFLGRERQQKHIMSNSPTFPVSLLFMAPLFLLLAFWNPLPADAASIREYSGICCIF